MASAALLGLLLGCDVPATLGTAEDLPPSGGDAGVYGGPNANADGGVAVRMPGCLDLPAWNSIPPTLSATGLYTDGGGLGPGVQPYAPGYALWSDGAEKERFLLLPCAPIDTRDMDHWNLPPGTRAWKEFRVDGGRVETRLIARTGTGAGDFAFATYLWDGGEAYRVTGGVQNAHGTSHDVPRDSYCTECHGLLTERLLGVSAVQLSHDGPGLTLAKLSSAGWLSVHDGGSYPVPGNASESAALGYLHANCGGCHNATGIHTITAFHLRVLAGERTVAQTGTVRTAVGKSTTLYFASGVGGRIVPGNPDASAVTHRMARRDFRLMPPVGTEQVDQEGLGAVRAWIESLDAGQ